MTRQVLLIIALSIIALTSSGCATILGGIIGHQSGEMCAGLAIGAAVDFGGDVIRGVGQMTAGEKDLHKDFQKKSNLNAQKGEITLPINPFNRKRTMNVVSRLRDTMTQQGWTCQQVEKTTRNNLIFANRWEETWHCTTETGRPFAFKIDFRSNRDTRFYVKSRPCDSAGTTAPAPDLTPQDISTITSKMYDWIEKAVI